MKCSFSQAIWRKATNKEWGLLEALNKEPKLLNQVRSIMALAMVPVEDLHRVFDLLRHPDNLDPRLVRLCNYVRVSIKWHSCNYNTIRFQSCQGFCLESKKLLELP
jgi:hypothetical protein